MCESERRAAEVTEDGGTVAESQMLSQTAAS